MTDARSGRRDLDSSRWKRIEQLFHSAADLDAAAQSQLLRDECGDDDELRGDVAAMLAEDAAGRSLLDHDRPDAAARLLAVPSREIAEGRFGPYRIVRLLGEGGSGVVYLAERRDVKNLVAIKFLRDAWLSPVRRSRFTSEQQTLAQLTHPSIARLYDAGTLDDGTPWFVMEYVDGLPLTEYCAQHASSIADRLTLFRAVCAAVAHAHTHGIVHRDLKPSNVLVKADGSVRLLDFGIAKQIDPAATPADRTKTGFHQLTPAYASPEQTRGDRTDVRTDVYSLGVVLYELLTGVLPFDVSAPVRSAAERPSTVAARRGGKDARAAWPDLDALCLTALHQDRAERYATVDAFAADVDHFLRSEPLVARGTTLWSSSRRSVRRHAGPVAIAVVVVAAIGAAWIVGHSAGGRANPPAAAETRTRTIAVLPFRNVNADADLNYLRLALPDEIATILSHIRSVRVTPSSTAARYDTAGADQQEAGRQMRVATVVTGHFQRAAGNLQVVLEAIDVATNRSLWRDTLAVPAENLIATQTQIGFRIRGGLAATLGWPASDAAARPENEEAYELFLRSLGVTLDPAANTPALRMLERSVALDPNYPPAWVALARRYYVDSRYGTARVATMARYEAAMQRALAVDPTYIAASTGLVLSRTERGDLVNAHAQAVDLVKRRPDSVDAHFILSYVLRYAGLLDEAASECDTAFLLEPHAQTSGLRSCAMVFVLRGESPRALEYADLDHGSDFAKAMTILALARQRRTQEAVAVGSPNIPQWNSYDLLLGCMQQAPAATIDKLAAAVSVSDDPEVNYFSAQHLAFCGRSDRALQLLDAALTGKYCSYPAMKTDPAFDDLRGSAAFAAREAAGMACQREFVAGRTGFGK